MGRGIEFGQEAVARYTTLLAKTQDNTVIEFIKHRSAALEAHNYLNPAEFNMSQQKFDEAKEILPEFINLCCLDGEVPTRPKFEEEITKTVYQTAGLSIFAGPLALIIIPAALLSIPFVKIVDRVNYANDQAKSEGYYAILDEAHAWIAAHIKTEAEELCPNHQAIREELSEFAKKYTSQYKSIPENNPSYKLKNIADRILFKKSILGDATVTSLNNRLKSINQDVKHLESLATQLNKAAKIASQLAEYMHDYNKQLASRGQCYYPGEYDGKEFNSHSLEGLPLMQLPKLLKSCESELAAITTEACTLSRDITVRLNAVQTEIDEAINTKRNLAQNTKDSVDQLEARFKGMY